MTEGTDPPADDPVAAWAASGAMALTGQADGPPLAPAAAVVPALVALAGTFTRHTGVPIDVGRLLSGRAATLGLRRQGQVSTNGSCRLLPTADGWAAVNLARPADVAAVGALVERTVDGDPWPTLALGLERMTGADVVERATLLAVPAAVMPTPMSAPAPRASTAAGAAVRSAPVPEPGSTTAPDDEATRRGPHGAALGVPDATTAARTAAERPEGTSLRRAGGAAGGETGSGLRRMGPAGPPRAASDQLTVVDLSAMWAGPLCVRLLGLAGARVVKVESTGRPDGARRGDARFFDWLHGGHESVALDLASVAGRAALARLVAAADVVIESSRPRALAQLGIDAAAVVASRPGVTWVSITGYGREGAAGRRVAFGDDAAVAAGLVAHDDRGRPVFCGDAIADPITGLTAAVGALASVATGGGHLVDVPMVDAVAATLAIPAPPAAADRGPDGSWQVTTATGIHPVTPPHPLPRTTLPAHPLGADTATVLDTLVAPC